MAKRRKKHQKRKYVIIAALILLILIIAFGTKIFLYIRFLIGNDTVVRLEVSKENFYLLHNQTENMIFKSSIILNPFCTSSCSSIFGDISENKIIESSNFVMSPGFPYQKEFALASPAIGEGQKIYLYHIECRTNQSLLCHTRGESTERSIIITLYYNLTPKEAELRETLKTELEALKQRISRLGADYSLLYNISLQLERNNITLGYSLSALNEKIEDSYSYLTDSKHLWDEQNYTLLKEKSAALSTLASEAESVFSEINNTANSYSILFNSIIDALALSKNKLSELSSLAYTQGYLTKVNTLNETISGFNDVVEVLRFESTISKKQALAKNIIEKIDSAYKTYTFELKQDVLEKDLFADIEYDSLCTLGICTPHPSIKERATQADTSLKSACSMLQQLESLYKNLNNSINLSLLNQTYPQTADFWNNITFIAKNIRQNTTNSYLDALPENQQNTEIIKGILDRKNLTKVEDYPGYNLTSALIFELAKRKIPQCSLISITLLEPVAADYEKISYPEIPYQEIEISFLEQPPKCCVFSICKECCLTEACLNNKNYPIVFVHGHWFSKDISPEYTLDSFNKMQKALEKENYLDAGAISLYTSRNVSYGLLGFANIPLTFKASYYFDTLQKPDNYIPVQSNSENIDTYSIRLKEIIDTIKYKTGKQKVIIISHSMGSLVVRRYLQIFGDSSVDKAVLIAPPNKGIVGKAKEICPLFGERRECDDMDASSVFMSKLNYGEKPKIPIYNIIGTGCPMDKSIGDKVVLEENAKLDYAENFIINGTCNNGAILHVDLIDIDKYPKVYEIIKGILKEK